MISDLAIVWCRSKNAEIISDLCLLAYYENTAGLLWRIHHVRFNTRNTFKYSTFGVLETIVFDEKNNPKFVVFSMNAERALLTKLDKKGKVFLKNQLEYYIPALEVQIVNCIMWLSDNKMALCFY